MLKTKKAKVYKIIKSTHTIMNKIECNWLTSMQKNIPQAWVGKIQMYQNEGFRIQCVIQC
jgi:hypothetical protein